MTAASPASPKSCPSPRPLILLSNDDGYQAEGLRALGEALHEFADVIVCAPESEQSTTSHSLSLNRPLRLRQVASTVFAVDGTPADCVYVALHSNGRVLPRVPDVVVSGMNHGLNLATDVFYSGTVAAAREGALRNILAVATSADLRADRESAARACARIVERAHRAFDRQGPAPLLNVNVPPGSHWELRATCLGKRLYEDIVEFRRDPRGREYLWIGGGFLRHDHSPDSDTEAYDEGKISVTSLLLDLTSESQRPLTTEVVRLAGPVGA